MSGLIARLQSCAKLRLASVDVAIGGFQVAMAKKPLYRFHIFGLPIHHCAGMVTGAMDAAAGRDLGPICGVG